MSDKLKDVRLNPIPVQLDRPRTILFDYNAFAELEEKFGDLDSMFASLEKPTLRDLQKILWAGLLHELPDPVEEDGKRTYLDGDNLFTVHYVGKIINGIQDLAAINFAVVKAISEVMPNTGKLKAVVTAMEVKKKE